MDKHTNTHRHTDKHTYIYMHISFEKLPPDIGFKNLLHFTPNTYFRGGKNNVYPNRFLRRCKTDLFNALKHKYAISLMVNVNENQNILCIIEFNKLYSENISSCLAFKEIRYGF